MIFDWDRSTPIQRNYFLAEHIFGWDGKPGYWNGKIIAVHADLPNWQGSDCLAITQVLPKLTEHGRFALDCGPRETKVFCFGDIYRISEGATLAEAICKAVIEIHEKKLKKESK